MAQPKLEWTFLRSRPAQILTCALVLQAALLYGFSRPEPAAVAKPLSTVDRQFGSWGAVNDTPIEKEILDILKADDILNRTYVSSSQPVAANLFVAFFQSQRAGQAPHSPKNCLPGTGWVPSDSGIVQVSIPGRAEPIQVNRYVVARSDAKSLVFYWYQSRDRVVASEYVAKFYTVADAIRYNHTDTALVRVVVPVSSDLGMDRAEAAAIDFIKTFYHPLRSHFPRS